MPESKVNTTRDLYNELVSELGNSSDLSTRNCLIGEERIPASVVWIDGLVSKQNLNTDVISPLISGTQQMKLLDQSESPHQLLCSYILTANHVKMVYTCEECVPLLVCGWTIILVDDSEGAIAVNTQGLETRSIDEPASSSVIRGPRDGFVEALGVNISLIRRRIRDKAFRVETLTVGNLSHTKIAMVYIHDRAAKETVDEIRKRLQKIDIDAVLESHYIEEIIKDSPTSFFPTVYSTERPDDVAGIILDGRVAIVVDGTPFVLALPCTLFHLLKTTEDLYLAYPVATFIRWIRYAGFFITLLLPSTYVGILTYHPEMVPPQLLSSILSARDGVPFPVLMEALIMEIIFEGLREASIRMPRSIGSAISIVGALVIGESAVQAGIISSPSVMIVAGTAIASFTIPSISLSGTIRMLRFFMLLLASLLGLYGIIIGLFMLGVQLASIQSVGLPYLSPFAPFKKKEAEKAIFRVPWFTLRKKR